MKYQIDHDLHIHSQLSLCSNDPEQNPARILQYARENGLKHICITDHFWDETTVKNNDWYDPQNFAHVCSALPLPQEKGTAFHFGCEADINRDFILGISKERLACFDFIIIPTTHLHMFSLPEDDAGCRQRADLYIGRLAALLTMDLPWHKIGIAHLACSLMAPGGELHRVLSLISEETLMQLFTRAAGLGVGIEINADDFNFQNKSSQNIDQILRLFGIAKQAGCKFYLGSDAHHPASLDRAVGIFESAISALGLQESDKFLPFVNP